MPSTYTHPLKLAASMQTMRSSDLREVMALASRPGVLSFAVGMPGTDLLPGAALARISSEVLARGGQALQYGMPPPELKQHVVRLMARRGVSCRPEQVFLTTGAQQAMTLLAHLLLDPGGRVLVEETVYEGALMALRLFQPEVLTVPTGAGDGIDLDAVESRLSRGERPALIYAMSEGHNPLGVSLPEAKRRRLVELARHHGVPIVEDDTYGFLHYEEPQVPPMRALDEDWVLYIGSFAKILAPALRVGWLVVPEELTGRLTMLKHALDVDTATLAQRLTAAFLDSEDFDAHLAELCARYRRRRDAMLASLAEHFPPGVRWNRPSGGLYVWVELRPGVDLFALLKRAVERERVAFSPGRAFSATGGPHADHCLRLSFAGCSVAEIEEGIPRLAQVVREA